LNQVLTLTGATATSTAFNLSFAGQTTATPLTYQGSGDASAIQSALNGPSGLIALAGLSGSATVTADPTDTVFTISFSNATTATHAVSAAITSGSGSVLVN